MFLSRVGDDTRVSKLRTAHLNLQEGEAHVQFMFASGYSTGTCLEEGQQREVKRRRPGADARWGRDGNKLLNENPTKPNKSQEGGQLGDNLKTKRETYLRNLIPLLLIKFLEL